jgi:hypothetical protein
MKLQELLSTMGKTQQVCVFAQNKDATYDTVFADTAGEAFANGFTIQTYGEREVSGIEIGMDVEYGKIDSSVTVIPIVSITLGWE